MKTLFYVASAFSVIFTSWFVGYLANEFVRKKKFYQNLSSLVFVKSEQVNKLIGIYLFKWIVTETPWKFTNTTIKIVKRPNAKELVELKREIVNSEIGHFFGFFFILLFGLISLALGMNLRFVFTLLIMNLFFNLYPSLLQQMNKIRIDRLLDNTK